MDWKYAFGSRLWIFHYRMEHLAVHAQGESNGSDGRIGFHRRHFVFDTNLPSFNRRLAGSRLLIK